MLKQISASALIVAMFATLSPAAAPSSDNEFLEMISRDSFNFFIENTSASNGLVRDSSAPNSPCSIASVGFALAAFCIGAENKWITRNEAYNRCLLTLETFRDRVPEEHGFFYHFLSMNSGKRIWGCELSSVDTALFIAGALFASEYFKGTEVDEIANELYARIDWPWMMNGQRILCMGWKPESGFLPYYWDSYCESMVIYALAIGSPTHPIINTSWDAFTRPRGRYGNYNFIYCGTGSLFVNQYSHCWIDFRNIKDSYANYWDNSVKATMANRQYCIDNMQAHKGYGEDCWGLSACIGPDGYKGYGGGVPGEPLNDGTVSPSAVAGSVPFAPKECIRALRYIYDNYGTRIYGSYGFYNGFNIDHDWFATEALGIDQGITLLMIENYRSQAVWKYFMRLPAVKRWLSQCMKSDIREK